MTARQQIWASWWTGEQALGRRRRTEQDDGHLRRVGAYGVPPAHYGFHTHSIRLISCQVTPLFMYILEWHLAAQGGFAPNSSVENKPSRWGCRARRRQRGGEWLAGLGWHLPAAPLTHKLLQLAGRPEASVVGLVSPRLCPVQARQPGLGPLGREDCAAGSLGGQGKGLPLHVAPRHLRPWLATLPLRSCRPAILHSHSATCRFAIPHMQPIQSPWSAATS